LASEGAVALSTARRRSIRPLRRIDRDEHPVVRAGRRTGHTLASRPAPRLERITDLAIGPCISLVGAAIQAYVRSMQTLPISKVKDRLNELVDAAASTREQVTITKNGSPAAVLIGVDEWESIQESLFWLSQPGIRESMAEAKTDVEEGRVNSEDQIRAEFNVPKSGR
jgi:antitoxin YefM